MTDPSTYAAPPPEPSVVYVAVVGSGLVEPEACQAAETVGRELARNRAVVVCGGLGGVMEAACRGAKAEGGTTVGILPGGDRTDANRWVDVAVPTGMGEGRNVLVVRAADAVVAVGGEFGTLSEIGFALRLGKPVVGVATWELARDGQPVDAVVPVRDPVAAARTALSLAGGEPASAGPPERPLTPSCAAPPPTGARGRGPRPL